MLKDYYNKIAKTYDQDYLEYERALIFPYEGYHRVLDVLIHYITSHRHLDHIKILDLGIGTAQLYEVILPDSMDITGFDLSKNMMEIGKLKCPFIHFYEWDLLKGIPEELKSQKYDFIVSTFTMHHFDTEKVLDIIHYYLDYLNPLGKIIIGDALFLDDHKKQLWLRNHLERHEDEFYFHTYSKIVSKIKEQLALSYMKVSDFMGIIIIENNHLLSLQYEKNLVEYSENTVKWKSTLSKKSRE